MNQKNKVKPFKSHRMRTKAHHDNPRLNPDINVTAIPCIDRINKLIKDLYERQIETIVVLADTSGDWTHQSASDKGFKFLNKYGSFGSKFLKFCTDCNNEETSVNHDVMKPADDGNQCEESTREIQEQIACLDETNSHNETSTNNDEEEGRYSPEVTDDYQVNIHNVQKFTKGGDQADNYRTLIDYLHAGLKVESSHNETINSIDEDNESGTVTTELINNVVQFYNDMASTQKKCANNGYRCILCNIKVGKSLLKKHLIKHKTILEGAMKTCDDCDLVLPEYYLSKHWCVQKHSLPKHVTAIERNIRNDIALIETKYHWHDFTKPIQCGYCDVILKDVSACRDHLVSHHLQEYHCEICKVVIHGYLQITQHMTEHTLGKAGIENLNTCVKNNWQCSQCNKTFVRKSTLRRHIEQIHGPVSSKLYSCHICKKTYRSVELLQKHQRNQKCRCNINNCEAVFASSLCLKKHRLIHHKDFLRKNKQFLCNVCGKGFLRNNILTAHLEWKHNIGQPEQCEICNKTFRGKAALSNHKASHRESLTYQCEICGNSYKQRSGLFKHKMSHHGNANSISYIHCCEICGKRFKTQKSLTHHLITQGHITPSQPVNSESILQCTECNKQFGIKDKLDRHVASVHRQMKLYKCEHCDKSFSDKSNYRHHLNIHAGLKPYCSLCKKSFRSQVKLKIHMEESHAPHGSLNCNPDKIVIGDQVSELPEHCDTEDDVRVIVQFAEITEDPEVNSETNNSPIQQDPISETTDNNVVKQQDLFENQQTNFYTSAESQQYTILSSANFVFNGGGAVPMLNSDGNVCVQSNADGKKLVTRETWPT